MTYIFRIPKDAPKLTFAGFETYFERLSPSRPNNQFGKPCRYIGSTVMVLKVSSLPWQWYSVRLYGLHIADIGPKFISFMVHDDRHQATRGWLERIIADNEIGHTCWRRKGVLYVDGNPELPLEGRTFRVGERHSAERLSLEV